jgi:ABC-type oligopeptide transport system ATPase subunit
MPHSMYQLPNYVVGVDPAVKSKTKVINLVGAPGSGKSTLAASLFAYMKQRDINVELVTEFAKDLTWKETLSKHHQVEIFSNQYSRMQCLNNKVDYIITDSPLLLNLFYNTEPYETFPSFVLEVYNSFDNVVFFVTRNKPYKKLGRGQTEEESNQLSKNMKLFVDGLGIKYTDITSDTSTAYIANMIEYSQI